MSNEKAIYNKNLEQHAKEIYEFINRLSSPIMNNFSFFRENPYNLRIFGLCIRQ